MHFIPVKGCAQVLVLEATLRMLKGVVLGPWAQHPLLYKAYVGGLGGCPSLPRVGSLLPPSSPQPVDPHSTSFLCLLETLRPGLLDMVSAVSSLSKQREVQMPSGRVPKQANARNQLSFVYSICQPPTPLGEPVVSPCVCLCLRVHVLLGEGAATEKR